MLFQPGESGGMMEARYGTYYFKGDADMIVGDESKQLDITFRLAIAGALAVAIVVLLKNVE